MKGPCFVGALKAVYERIDISKITDVYGVSAGSIIALCLSLEVEFEDMKTMYLTYPPYSSKSSSITNIFSKYGINNHEATKNLIIKFLELKNIPIHISMNDFNKERAIKLHVCTTNVTKYTKDIFCKDDVKLVDALIASCSIPIVFTPVTIDGDMHIDGGALWKFPIELLESDSIGVCLYNQLNRQLNENYKSYFSQLWGLFTSYFSRTDIDGVDERIINIDATNIQMPVLRDEPTSDDEWQELFDAGYNAAEAHIKKRYNI